MMNFHGDGFKPSRQIIMNCSRRVALGTNKMFTPCTNGQKELATNVEMAEK
jgi:hypothetical protein